MKLGSGADGGRACMAPLVTLCASKTGFNFFEGAVSCFGQAQEKIHEAGEADGGVNQERVGGADGGIQQRECIGEHEAGGPERGRQRRKSPRPDAVGKDFGDARPK